MFSTLKRAEITVDGQTYAIRQASAKTQAAIIDGRAAGKSELEILAAICADCIERYPDGSEDKPTAEQMLDNFDAQFLGRVSSEIMALDPEELEDDVDEDDPAGKSEAGPVAVSS